jgi:DNA repair protein RecN (Recombination protein N)
MLKYIKISNYILVKEAEIYFSEQLNIFSGETGAGKSVLMEAVNTVLGGTVRSGMVFNESEPAKIEICFTIDKQNQALMNILKEYDLDHEEEELYFTKVITPSLKTKTYLNGIRSTNAVIKKFRDILIDFHSQRDQQNLFDNSYQLQIIDSFGAHENLLEDFKARYHEYAANLQKLKYLIKLDNDNQDKFELFSYQLQEIAQAGITENEDAALNDEFNLLTHSEDLINLQENFNQDSFEKENSLFDQINGYLAQMSDFQTDSPHINNAVNILHDILAGLESAAEELSRLKSSIDIDPQRLDDVTERLDFLNSLKVKYKRSLPEIIEYSQQIKNFIDNFGTQQVEISRLKKKLETVLADLQKTADHLTSVRKQTAQRFADILQKNIKKLAMPAAQVDIIFHDLIMDDNEYFKFLQPQGKDQVEIYFTANLGVDLQPLKVAASGGELSRFLLAVKKILAEFLHSKTIIFDEIDTGIGGKTADYTGEFIADVAKHHQVICITHLAQIAAFAENHYLIEKRNEQNISHITVKKLDNKNIVGEIARMLSGSESDSALKHAGELINKCRERQCLD